MARRYIQGRKLFWASLALVLVLVVLPYSLGVAYWWNENVAGQEIIAYELNNETLTEGEFYATSGMFSFTFNEATTTITKRNLTPFWDANGSWDEVILPSFTNNESYAEGLFIVWNLTAKRMVDMNINEIHIKIKGLSNTTNETKIYIHVGKPTIEDNNEDKYILTNNKIVKIDNGTLDYTLKIEPAIAAMLNSKYGNNSITFIQIYSPDEATCPFESNSILDFQIYATKPHGTLVFYGYDFMQWVLGAFTFLGVVVLFVTSPAWNPTTHNGLIERMINRAKYRARARKSSRSRRKKSRRKKRRKR